jgi:hypothetical protein
LSAIFQSGATQTVASSNAATTKRIRDEGLIGTTFRAESVRRAASSADAATPIVRVVMASEC